MSDAEAASVADAVAHADPAAADAAAADGPDGVQGPHGVLARLPALAKGNLWRVLAEQTVTVFAHDDGTFGWSIAGPGRGRPRYSAGGYVTEAAAMEALAAELGQR